MLSVSLLIKKNLSCFYFYFHFSDHTARFHISLINHNTKDSNNQYAILGFIATMQPHKNQFLVECNFRNIFHKNNIFGFSGLLLFASRIQFNFAFNL